MKLLTDEIRAALPALYSQDGKGMEAVAVVKFFNPAGAGTWYASEFDGDDTFFGWAEIHPGCGELGYFSLAELESVRVMGGTLGIERDIYWTPKTLAEVTAERDTGLRGEDAPAGYYDPTDDER